MTNDALTIYLLHFDPPLRRASHYMGICRTDRLGSRLTEHLKLKGARITADALRQGSTLTLVRLWHHADWPQERRLKEAGHFARLCPLCRGGLPNQECQAYRPLAQVAQGAPPVTLVSFPASEQPAESRPKKKRSSLNRSVSPQK